MLATLYDVLCKLILIYNYDIKLVLKTSALIN